MRTLRRRKTLHREGTRIDYGEVRGFITRGGDGDTGLPQKGDTINLILDGNSPFVEKYDLPEELEGEVVTSALLCRYMCRDTNQLRGAQTYHLASRPRESADASGWQFWRILVSVPNPYGIGKHGSDCTVVFTLNEY